MRKIFCIFSVIIIMAGIFSIVAVAADADDGQFERIAHLGVFNRAERNHLTRDF